MESFPKSDVTSLLVAWSNEDSLALDQLLPLVYQELRRLARYYMTQERAGHTLQATALVNEAYLNRLNRWFPLGKAKAAPDRCGDYGLAKCRMSTARIHSVSG